jgi:hypothetical protein
MKLEKLSAFLVALITISLISSTYFNNEASNCISDINLLNNEANQNNFNMITSIQASFFILTNLIAQNYTTMKYEGNNTIYIDAPDEYKETITSFFELSSGYQHQVKNLTDKIQQKQVTCREKSEIASISLYVALVFSLLSLILAAKLFKEK